MNDSIGSICVAAELCLTDDFVCACQRCERGLKPKNTKKQSYTEDRTIGQQDPSVGYEKAGD